jgi:hypothetical protein
MLLPLKQSLVISHYFSSVAGGGRSLMYMAFSACVAKLVAFTTCLLCETVGVYYLRGETGALYYLRCEIGGVYYLRGEISDVYYLLGEVGGVSYLCGEIGGVMIMTTLDSVVAFQPRAGGCVVWLRRRIRWDVAHWLCTRQHQCAHVRVSFTYCTMG